MADLVLVPPHDPELELSVLAEALDPLHVVPRMADVRAADFYDPRHVRIFRKHVDGTWPLSPDDEIYARNVVAYAWPLTAGALDRFLDYASRRRRIAELERERLDLYGVTA